jgi:hypothetical protein
MKAFSVFKPDAPIVPVNAGAVTSADLGEDEKLFHEFVVSGEKPGRGWIVGAVQTVPGILHIVAK